MLATDDNAGERTELVLSPAFIIHTSTQTGLFVMVIVNNGVGIAKQLRQSRDRPKVGISRTLCQNDVIPTEPILEINRVYRLS